MLTVESFSNAKRFHIVGNCTESMNIEKLTIEPEYSQYSSK